MPTQKDFKRLVRARMEKTGEAYTTARAQLLNQRNPPVRRYPDLAGMSDDAVLAKTGRTWKQWVALLDDAEAMAMPHREIAELLHGVHRVDDWWAQMVTVGYERIRGLRVKGQRQDGSFDVNKSKTVPVAVEHLFRAFSDARQRRRWLGDIEVEARKSTPNKSVRFRWEDGCPVEALFYSKGNDKSQVAIQHRKLPSQEAADAARGAWTKRLDRLSGHLTPGGHDG